MEDFLESETMSCTRQKRHLEGTLKNRTLECWRTFCFWTLAILLGVRAMINA
jgi:hypothetical protein